nr:efflux RND transporter periplasmic adaptor subunit [Roseomonas acroporae]
MLLGCLATTPLLLAGCDETVSAREAGAAPPPPTVTVVSLAPEAVILHTTLPGRTNAFQIAEIRPQVGGVLQQRLFHEGETVAAGQPLYQIDPAPYRAALASAEAALAKAVATLASAQATATRYRPLVAQNAVSRLDYETAQAAQKSAEAEVASARAAVDTARINLGYTRVAAPIAGRSSRSSVTVGALVTADQTTALMTVTQLDPIYVDVVQPSATVLRLRREMAAGTLRRAGDGAEAHLLLEDGTPYPLAGRLQFAEVAVSPDTNTVTLRAEFPNPDGTLLPGMFVRATLEEGTVREGLLVPQQGVTHNTRGEATAMVAQADGSIATRVLSVVRAIGNKWLVNGGLRDGDRVVVEGTQRVRDGMKPQLRVVTAAEFDAQVQREAAAARTGQRG